MSGELVLATKHFPDLVVEIDGGYWLGDIELDGEQVPVSIFVDSCLQDKIVLERAAHQLNSLEAMTQTAVSAIRNAATASGSVVSDFLVFHRDEVPEAIPTNLSAEPLPKLVGALALVGVAVHPVEPNSHQIVLDFSFGRDLSDAVLAATFTAKGQLDDICHES